MDIEEYRDYCMSKKGATESTPFPKLQNILVFKVMGKMFTATDLNNFDGFSIKCVPETIDELRAKYSALQKPPYFSEKHWSMVVLDDSVPTKKLQEWLDTSYDLVVAKLTRKQKAELEEM